MTLTPRRANLGLLAALLAVVVGIWLVVRDSTPSQAAAARTASVTRATVTSQVSGTGNLASPTSATLDFATGGTITKIAVKAGQVVKGGDVLAKIDPSDAKAAVAEARADLEAAQAQYDETAAGQTSDEAKKDQLSVQSARLSVSSAQKSLTRARQQATLDIADAEASLERARQDRARGTGTTSQVTAAKRALAQTRLKAQQSVDQATDQLAAAQNQLAQQQVQAAANAEGPTSAQLAQAKSSVSQAKAALDDAEAALDDTTLRAPADGTVMSIDGEVGETTGSGSGSGGSDTGSGSTDSGSSGSSGFLVLTDLTAMEVTANVAEADIGDVEVGQTAQVTLSAAGDVVPGTVTAVALQGTTSNNVVQYPVTVSLDQVPDGARLGASATVVITTGTVEDTLSLPSSAISTVGRNHTVTLVKDGVSTVTPVEIGLVGTSSTEIVSGVAEGDRVALPISASSGGTGIPGFGGGGLGGPGFAGGGRAGGRS